MDKVALYRGMVQYGDAIKSDTVYTSYSCNMLLILNIAILVTFQSKVEFMMKRDNSPDLSLEMGTSGYTSKAVRIIALVGLFGFASIIVIDYILDAMKMDFEVRAVMLETISIVMLANIYPIVGIARTPKRSEHALKFILELLAHLRN